MWRQQPDGTWADDEEQPGKIASRLAQPPAATPPPAPTAPAVDPPWQPGTLREVRDTGKTFDEQYADLEAENRRRVGEPSAAPGSAGAGGAPPDATTAPSPLAEPFQLQTPAMDRPVNKSETVSTTTKERVKRSAGEIEAGNQRIQAADEAAQEAKGVADEEAERTPIRAAGAERKREIAATSNERVREIIDAGDAEYKRRQGLYQQAEREFKESGAKSFWAEKTTGERVAGGIGIILGALAQVVGARARLQLENRGLAAVERGIEEHVRRKEKSLMLAKDARDEARNNRDDALKMLKIEQAALYDEAAAELEANLARTGRSPEQIQATKSYLTLKEKAAGIRQEVESADREQIKSTVQRHVTTMDRAAALGGAAVVGDKPLDKWSGDEKKNEGFAQRMYAAHQTMQRYQYTPEDVKAIKNTMLAERVLPKGANALRERFVGTLYESLSPEGKKRFLAEQDFAGANLRRESGAVIGTEETMKEVDAIGERPGETPETRKAKEQQRLARIMGVGVSTGRPGWWTQALNGLTGTAQAAPAAPGARPSPVEEKTLRDPKTGRTLKARKGPDGKWYEAQ